jgi:phosphinothricin acetyltransferase
MVLLQWRSYVVLDNRMEGVTDMYEPELNPVYRDVLAHEKLGFEKAALFRKVGFKFDRWIDVGYWQMTLSVSKNQRPF